MHKGRLGVAVLLLFAAVFCFSGCNIKSDEKTVFVRDTDPAYIDLLRDIAPDCTVRDGKGLSSLLSSVDGEDKAFALFDVQARASKDAGTGGIWYEHFATAAVIAVDRSRFDGKIKGWRDLENISCPVGFTSRYERMLFAAVSYGLEKNYMSGEAVGLLHKLNKSGRLSYGKIDAPVNICWDYQAALMKREGKNIEIIIPSEGTLLYGVGVLSGYEMKFSQNAGDAIAAAGFRADKAQGENYPSLSEYGRAERVGDAVEFARQTENFISVFKRGVFRSRLYSSAESFEHKLLGAAVIMTAIIWMGFALRRVQRKDIRMLVRALGGMVIAWMLVCILKYQTDGNPVMGRYLWYAYYVFMMGLPLLMLILSLMTDSSGNVRQRKIFVCSGFAVYAVLLLTVLTNDLHGWVFKFEDIKTFSGGYTYNFGYYLIFAFIVAVVILSTAILVRKAMRGFNRSRLFLPILSEVLLFVYCAAYAAGVPVARDSDITTVSCIFALAFAELAMRTGLVPVNQKYAVLFSNSPLRMQIIDSEGNAELSSAGARPISREDWEKLRDDIKHPLLLHGDTLLYADGIPGGMIVWQESIAEILNMQQEIRENVLKLTSANKLLVTERESKYRLAAAEENVRLMELLNAEMERHLERMNDMIDGLERSNSKQRDIARITLLMCYIKRRCSLFFKEQEGGDMPAEELAVYIDELSEFASYADIRISTVCTAKGSLSPRCGSVMYDFFYSVLDSCAGEENTLLERLADTDGMTEMKLLPSSFDGGEEFMSDELKKAVEGVGGTVSVKDLDETAGISLRVPKGGKAP